MILSYSFWTAAAEFFKSAAFSLSCSNSFISVASLLLVSLIISSRTSAVCCQICSSSWSSSLWPRVIFFSCSVRKVLRSKRWCMVVLSLTRTADGSHSRLCPSCTTSPTRPPVLRGSTTELEAGAAGTDWEDRSWAEKNASLSVSQPVLPPAPEASSPPAVCPPASWSRAAPEVR